MLVKMNVIFPLCIGYLNSTNVHTNSAILLGLPNVPPNLCQCYFTSILTTVKEGLQKYSDTSYSRSGVNDMWILKNSNDLLGIFRSKATCKFNSVKTFDFSTLYTTIPHEQLKDRMRILIHRFCSNKNGERRYKYIVVGIKKLTLLK